MFFNLLISTKQSLIFLGTPTRGRQKTSPLSTPDLYSFDPQIQIDLRCLTTPLTALGEDANHVTTSREPLTE